MNVDIFCLFCDSVPIYFCVSVYVCVRGCVRAHACNRSIYTFFAYGVRLGIYSSVLIPTDVRRTSWQASPEGPLVRMLRGKLLMANLVAARPRY